MEPNEPRYIRVHGIDGITETIDSETGHAVWCNLDRMGFKKTSGGYGICGICWQPSLRPAHQTAKVYNHISCSDKRRRTDGRCYPLLPRRESPASGV